MKYYWLLFFLIFISCSDTTTDKNTSCKNECNEKGIICDEVKNTLYSCNFDENKCLKKELIEECFDSETCNTGECLPKDCESECNLVGFFCENNQRYECGNFNSDICYEKKEAFCEEGYSCTGMGVCSLTCSNTEEVCDGIDNDCDGDTDEDLIPPDAENQEGVCIGSKKVCSGVNGWIEPSLNSIPNYKENDESCNGVDNNCDGDIDEGYINQTTTCGLGVCKNNGGQIYCDAGTETTVCEELIENKTVEICDGLDNDCDGETDEDLIPPDAENQEGVCIGSKKVCDGVNGWIEPSLNSIPDYEENDESCNGVDNNCNGSIDEGYTKTTITCGNGICLNSALTDCVSGVESRNCTPLNVATEEICDNLDNNCDGSVDEGFDIDNDGISDCFDNCKFTQNSNQNNNDNDSLGDVCDCYPNRTNIAIEEVCDGVDNNCNGLIDEGNICSNTDCTQQIYNNHNYIFCSSATITKSWEDAKKYCNERNYNLVTIETSDENTWLRSIISDNHWIGLNDISGVHKWESGIGTIWNIDHDDANEDCWELRSNDPLWHDKNCTGAKRFICEENFNIQTRPTIAKSCKEIRDYALSQNNPIPPSGNYYINLGTNIDFKPQLVMCDMDTDGGGWTLVASWYYDYNWTKASNSTSSYFGMTTKDTVSANFGNMLISDFRIVATENLLYRGLERNDDTGIPIGATGADWYYHYNTPLMWKQVWAPQEHNGINQDDCSNGYTSFETSIVRQSLKKFNYSFNIKYNYQNNNHKWNNLSDWGVIYTDADGVEYNQPDTCDRIANYWGALTTEGIEFNVYNTSGYEDPNSDGTLGLPIKDNTTNITGQDVVTDYNALVGYDDDNACAEYGVSSTDIATPGGNANLTPENSTKLWWFVR